jgi:hypothetical protein
MKRLQAMASAFGEGDDFAKVMGADDKLASMLRITADGGEKLSVKVIVNARYLPKMWVTARGGAAAPPPPPQLIK